jgi:SAM-dependent methyltransferase
MVSDRDELRRLNIIHDFDAARAVANLRGCYGQLARRFYLRIIRDVKGQRVLDAGCGFGQFSNLCLERGLHVHAIDVDEISLAVARSEYSLPCLNESIYRTSLPDKSIDTIVSNEAICHFDIDRFLSEAHRLEAHRIIVHDSNTLNPLLSSYRRSTGHQEYRPYTPFEVVHLFESFRFACTKLEFVNFLSLPVSGGFQKKPIPIVSRFPSVVYALDGTTERLLSTLMARHKLAFRFIAVFDRRVV